MQTIAGHIEARPRLFRYPHDFRADFRARLNRDPEEALRFLSADEEFLRDIDMDDSQLPRAPIHGRHYSVNAVSDTIYRPEGQDFFLLNLLFIPMNLLNLQAWRDELADIYIQVVRRIGHITNLWGHHGHSV
jgi:hypothetical protein